jgi:SAF domain
MMTQTTEPRAARLRRPSWRDTRLLVGVLLVLASVALGTMVVATADETTPVLAAATGLGPGHRLVDGDLRVVRARLSGPVADYLKADAALPDGAVVLRPLGAGELVPASAVGPPAALTRRPVAITVTTPLPDGVRPGAQVDLWASARDPAATAGAAYRAPVRLAVGAQVSAVTVPEGGLTTGSGSAVQVLVAQSELATVLDALANEARLAVVPIPGSAPPQAASG